jgi:hypothetical protein
VAFAPHFPRAVGVPTRTHTARTSPGACTCCSCHCVGALLPPLTRVRTNATASAALLPRSRDATRLAPPRRTCRPPKLCGEHPRDRGAGVDGADARPCRVPERRAGNQHHNQPNHPDLGSVHPGLGPLHLLGLCHRGGGAGETFHQISLDFAHMFTRELWQIAALPLGEEQRPVIAPSGCGIPNKERKLTIF